MNKADEIKYLEQKLIEADTLYHSFGNSSLTDAEYDALKDRLRLLDSKHKLLKKVGNVDSASSNKKKKDKEHWEKFQHADYKMGSQNKITTPEELIKWCDKRKDDKYVVQHKMDGISIKMIYENGILTKAVTRGDGEQGEDIYKNVIKMKNVPHDIPNKNTVIIRGEIILTKTDFPNVGGKNPRNSAAGASKQLDGKNCEHLTVLAYSIMNWKELGLTTEIEVLTALKTYGFTSVKSYVATNATSIQDIMDRYAKTDRALLEWEIDGLVIKTNTLHADAWDYPEFSIAYKFESETGITTLIGIIWQDSGGRINPVAVLEPVDIAGTTISRATLNNIEHIKKLKIHIGDVVIISRRNDVIPCVEGVSITAPNGKPIVAPTHDVDGFPIVHAKNSQGEELVYLVSTNPNSKAKKVRQIMKWYEAHDAKGIAEETIALILDAGITTDLPAFFTVGLNGHTDLAGLDGFGSGKFRILNKATKLTQQTDLIKFMNAIDLSGFGTSRFEAILEHANKDMSVQDFILYCSDAKTISTISGFGMNTAEALSQALYERKDIIASMLALVQVDVWKPAKVDKSSKINGLSFCFTGSMRFDRTELEAAVKKRGGLVSGVSKHLDYLVTNDPNSGSSKNTKADKLGIKKINEQSFIAMIGGAP